MKHGKHMMSGEEMGKMMAKKGKGRSKKSKKRANKKKRKY